jgi:natural product precursor
MKSLKLNKINKSQLNNEQMKSVLGGNCCGCGCHYAGSGGSSTTANGNANHAGGLNSATPWQEVVCSF